MRKDIVFSLHFPSLGGDLLELVRRLPESVGDGVLECHRLGHL